MILYTLYKNSYIDIAHLESTKGITCYVNSTNRCTCSCTFCLRQTKEMIENNSLWLKKEPTVEEIKAEFDKYDLNDFKEVVFCGFGEPLMRHDDLMQEDRIYQHVLIPMGFLLFIIKEILHLNLKVYWIRFQLV